MSGIVAIINTDGAPIDRQLLRRLTDFMTFRGPDAQDIWLAGHVGFGHTMLRTTFESATEQQPFTLDGQVWITADARIDGRTELIQKLTGKGRHVLASTPDVELILHAWHVWGEACLEHLLGDFAFAIWDQREQQLFCARDHFGIKPFFYSQVGNHLLISNTLNCLRLHPAVSDELNDHFIGDFLLTGFYVNPEISAFADIQRLPAAHSLKWKAGTVTIRRYWTLPINDPVYYKRSEEYVERFDELLTTAVADRLRTNSVAVFMSGGIDSPTVAATANKILKQTTTSFDLQAYTVVYDRLIPDEERYYAGLVAKHLNIPINYLVADDYKPFERWNKPETQMPEPACIPFSAITTDQFRQASKQSRVVLTGQGGDVILRPSFSYLLNLAKQGNLFRLSKEIGHHLIETSELPRIGMRTRIKRWYNKSLSNAPFPEWLNAKSVEDLDLQQKWRKLNSEPPFLHPHRPEAYYFTVAPFWSFLSETLDSATTRQPVDTRHPLLDIRLVGFTMVVPSLPWCVDKKLIRSVMRNLLPGQTLNRKKAPLAAEPLDRWLPNKALDTKRINPSPTLRKYINFDSFFSLNDQDHTRLWVNLRPFSLCCWAQNLNQIRQDNCQEEYHEVSV